MYTNDEMLKSALDDLNRLSLIGIDNWQRVLSACKKIVSVRQALSKEQEARDNAYKASLEEAKARREQQLKEAEARGETVLGGETVRINADGTQEVLIP